MKGPIFPPIEVITYVDQTTFLSPGVNFPGQASLETREGVLA